MSSVQELRAEINLPMPTAIWVVFTHIFVLACPLVFIWAIQNYSALLPRPLAYPTLVNIASAIYIGSTAFEVAQNSADRWYLTEATRSVADLGFNFFMTVAFCMYTFGFSGNTWMFWVSVICTIIYPFAYIKDHPSHRGLSGTVVLLATISFYLTILDPTVFLFLVFTGLGVFFITFLMKQLAQWLHGIAAFTFGVAFLFWPWAILNAVDGEPNSWAIVIGLTAVVIFVAAALAPVLAKNKSNTAPI